MHIFIYSLPFTFALDSLWEGRWGFGIGSRCRTKSTNAIADPDLWGQRVLISVDDLKSGRDGAELLTAFE